MHVCVNYRLCYGVGKYPCAMMCELSRLRLKRAMKTFSMTTKDRVWKCCIQLFLAYRNAGLLILHCCIYYNKYCSTFSVAIRIVCTILIISYQ